MHGDVGWTQAGHMFGTSGFEDCHAGICVGAALRVARQAKERTNPELASCLHLLLRSPLVGTACVRSRPCLSVHQPQPMLMETRR